jgi:small subunit ribosomal protein S20
LANSLQATKRARQDAKRGQHRATIKKAVRTLMKKTETAIEGKNLTEAKAHFIKFQSAADKAAMKNIFNKKTTSRKKSRLNARMKKLAEEK